MRVVEPSKEGNESILQFTMAGTLTMKPIPLIFEDLYESQRCDDSFKNLRTISFRLHNENRAGIVVANSEKKLRVQANDFASLWLVVRDLVNRFHENYRGKEIYDIINFEQPIPL